MMHPTDQNLSDYADGALDADERGIVADHLGSCADCRAVAADFGELRRTSAALGTMEPPARAWIRIERALREASVDDHRSASHAPAGGGHSLRRWPWLAAAAALVLTTALSVWLVRAPLVDETPLAMETATAQAVEAELIQAQQHYERAISGLEQIANAEKSTLDPRTAATLQENMGVVDQAITESRAAVNAQPASDPARRSLLDSFKAKIELLQNTITLINDMRTGDDAGAAQAISRLKRGN